MKLAHFGEVTLADGDVVIVDGGTHGVSGHTLAFRRSGVVEWARRVGTMGPRGAVGAGTMTLDDATRATAAGWLDEAWVYAANNPTPSTRAPGAPPRWVWAIAMRRGDEVRVVERDPAIADPPAELSPLLDFLRDAVDRAAHDAPAEDVRLFVTSAMGDNLGVDEGEVVVKETRGAEWRLLRAAASGAMTWQRTTKEGRSTGESFSPNDEDSTNATMAGALARASGSVLASRRDSAPWKRTAPGDAIANLKDVLSARWWLVATRRANVVNVWEGKGDPPSELEPILAWLRARCG